jgi:hypothetical protein
LQFPSAGPVTSISKLARPSTALQGVFLASCRKNSRNSEKELSNLLVCYRFFKEMRNMLAHNGGKADSDTVKSYQAFRSVATVSALGLSEVPLHHAVVLGGEINLELRGVIGLSDVILRIITTYDAILSESKLAEQELTRRLSPVTKKNQLVKAAAKDKRILSLIHNSGLPSAILTSNFVKFLQTEKIIPAFW